MKKILDILSYISILGAVAIVLGGSYFITYRRDRAKALSCIKSKVIKRACGGDRSCTKVDNLGICYEWNPNRTYDCSYIQCLEFESE